MERLTSSMVRKTLSLRVSIQGFLAYESGNLIFRLLSNPASPIQNKSVTLRSL